MANDPQGTRANSVIGLVGEDELATSIIGLIEFDPAAGHFTGKIIGFPHIEFFGPTVLDVQSKLAKATKSMTELARVPRGSFAIVSP